MATFEVRIIMDKKVAESFINQFVGHLTFSNAIEALQENLGDKGNHTLCVPLKTLNFISHKE